MADNEMQVPAKPWDFIGALRDLSGDIRGLRTQMYSDKKLDSSEAEIKKMKDTISNLKLLRENISSELNYPKFYNESNINTGVLVDTLSTGGSGPGMKLEFDTSTMSFVPIKTFDPFLKFQTGEIVGEDKLTIPEPKAKTIESLYEESKDKIGFANRVYGATISPLLSLGETAIVSLKDLSYGLGDSFRKDSNLYNFNHPKFSERFAGNVIMATKFLEGTNEAKDKYSINNPDEKLADEFSDYYEKNLNFLLNTPPASGDQKNVWSELDAFTNENILKKYNLESYRPEDPNFIKGIFSAVNETWRYIKNFPDLYKNTMASADKQGMTYSQKETLKQQLFREYLNRYNEFRQFNEYRSRMNEYLPGLGYGTIELIY